MEKLYNNLNERNYTYSQLIFPKEPLEIQTNGGVDRQ